MEVVEAAAPFRPPTDRVVARPWPVLPRPPCRAGEAQQGIALLEMAVPFDSTTIGSVTRRTSVRDRLTALVLGMGPHKRSVTVEVMKRWRTGAQHGSPPL